MPDFKINFFDSMGRRAAYEGTVVVSILCPELKVVCDGIEDVWEFEVCIINI